MEIKHSFVIYIIIIFSILTIGLASEYISFKSLFDIRAVQDTVSVSVSVVEGDTTPPNLKFTDPKSRKYIGEKGLFIYGSADDASNISSIWYNLDNGTNKTIPIPTEGSFFSSTFNSSSGDHVFYIFANDTENNINDSEYVNFTIDSYFDSNETITSSDGYLIFDDPEINKFVQNISGLNSDWTTNFTLYNNITPSGWEAPTNVREEMFYFEISVNTLDDTTGAYTMYFNLSSSQLGEVSQNDIRGFFFDNNLWNELTTTIENGNVDPIEFSVALTHLSRFLIAEKSTTQPSGAGTSGAGEGSGGGGVQIPKKEEKVPTPPELEIPKEPIEEKPKKKFPIISKIKEIQELPLINIVVVFIILTILVFIIVKFESWSKKRKERFKR